MMSVPSLRGRITLALSLVSLAIIASCSSTPEAPTSTSVTAGHEVVNTGDVRSGVTSGTGSSLDGVAPPTAGPRLGGTASSVVGTTATVRQPTTTTTFEVTGTLPDQ